MQNGLNEGEQAVAEHQADEKPSTPPSVHSWIENGFGLTSSKKSSVDTGVSLTTAQRNGTSAQRPADPGVPKRCEKPAVESIAVVHNV